MGEQAAGVCEFEKTKYQNPKEIRVGTRGGIGIFCAHEALQNAGSLDDLDPSRIGVY